LRQIGTFPKDRDPRVLVDHLLSLGIATRVVEKPESWDVWVLSEDHVPRAREELEAFQLDPEDPRYIDSRPVAQAIRRESDRRDREFRKNFRQAARAWDGPGPGRVPLTTALMAACIVLYLVIHWDGRNIWLVDRLTFTSFLKGLQGERLARGLDDILNGEVWRLITPIFLHFGILHIVFDMWALKVLGTLIEYRRGTLTFAVLVFLSAVASDVGQYLYNLNFSSPYRPFGGMSGVVYALFGYVWMKGRHEPEQGMILHPSSIRTMLLWLLLCMTGLLGPIANAAHVVGLVVGVLFGLARF
jgi:GlpG protein